MSLLDARPDRTLGRGSPAGTTSAGSSAEARAPRRTRRARAAAVGGLLALVAGAWALAPQAVLVTDPVPSVPAADGLLVEGYGPSGTLALHYRYGEQMSLTVPLESSSVVPFRVTGVELVEPAYPLLEPVGGPVEPVELGPFGDGEVVLEFEFTNCRYYHERANNTYEQVRLTGTSLGREVTRTVDLAVPLVVHSQVILDCPERTFVRGDDRRI